MCSEVEPMCGEGKPTNAALLEARGWLKVDGWKPKENKSSIQAEEHFDFVYFILFPQYLHVIHAPIWLCSWSMRGFLIILFLTEVCEVNKTAIVCGSVHGAESGSVAVQTEGGAVTHLTKNKQISHNATALRRWEPFIWGLKIAFTWRGFNL